jgi:hypothetical protein
MSHFDEMSCLLYLDGQLDSQKTREFELHTRACSACRSLLAALQRESALLHQAMLEEEESVPARLLAPPERMPWGWISLAFASLGVFTLWTEVIEPMQAQMSQAGFGGVNLLAMLIFSGAFWKGWDQIMVLLQFFAAGALGAPLLFLLWRNRRRVRPVALVLCTLALLLAWPSPAGAAEMVKKERYTLPAGETLANDLIVTAGPVRIEGTVDGDLIAFCESVVIEGRVAGDVIVFTRRLTVNGEVGGSVRGFANSASINGTVTRNLMAFTEQVVLDEKASIGGGATLFAESLELSGRIGRDVLAFGKRLDLDSFVGGSLLFRGETLSIGSRAEILGKAKYRGRKEPQVDGAAKLASPLEIERPSRRPDYARPGFYWGQALRWGVGFIFGLVTILLLPDFFREIQRATQRYGPAFGFGAVSLVAIPILAVIACITIVGLAVGIGSLVLWIIALYACKVIVGTWLGERLLGPSTSTAGLVGRMALGTLILRVATAIPYIGSVVLCAYVLWGLGAITLAVYDRLRWKPSVPAVAPAA